MEIGIEKWYTGLCGQRSTAPAKSKKKMHNSSVRSPTGTTTRMTPPPSSSPHSIVVVVVVDAIAYWNILFYFFNNPYKHLSYISRSTGARYRDSHRATLSSVRCYQFTAAPFRYRRRPRDHRVLRVCDLCREFSINSRAATGPRTARVSTLLRRS